MSGVKTYIHVHWRKNFPNEPKEILTELDQGRREIRKIEVFSDDSLKFISEELNQDRLADQFYPPMDIINNNHEFSAREILSQDFDLLWNAKNL